MMDVATHAKFIGPRKGAMFSFEDVHQLYFLLEMAYILSLSKEGIQ